MGKRRASLWWGVGLLVISVPGERLYAEADWQPEREMQLPAQVWLETGKCFVGRVSRLTGSHLYLMVQDGVGSAELGFPVAQVQRLIPPGEKVWQQIHQLGLHARQEEAQLRLYRLLYREWMPYLSLLDDDFLEILLPLMPLELECGNIYRAVGMATRMLRLAEERPGLRPFVRQLEDVVLHGTHSLGLEKQAAALAEESIRLRNRRETTLACLVLAEIAYTGQQYEQALWMALRPLLYPLPASEYVEACYMVAIAASIRLKEERQIRFLLEDMKSMGIGVKLHDERYRSEYEQALRLGEEL